VPSRRDPISELRRAIDGLPETTREAMLAGIRSNNIIVGAYTDSQGGICPMLAAHRQGARTEALRFARAWDAFGSVRRVRRASRRELRILEINLIESLATEAPETDLGAVIAEHQALRRETAARAARETAQPEIRASRLRDRPRKADADSALANLDHYVRAAERELETTT
jgi:hypothetical protein